MPIRRRDFLQATAGTAASFALGGWVSGCGESPPPFVEDTDWSAGEVVHLLPTASHDRIRLKASLRSAIAEPPLLRVDEFTVPGRQTDSTGSFFVFDAAGLDPDRSYRLQLTTAAAEPLCDPWPLRTFPAPSARPDRFRLLSYTCAGGSDLFRHPWQGPIFVPVQIRRRLLARALSFHPDAAIANGDHVYWDIRSRAGVVMGRSLQAWWDAGYFARQQPILGNGNEEVLKSAFGPQIADLYGTLFRSLPVFFVQDDHDYSENDEASDELRTFPPGPFMIDLARATQRLYYPEFLPGPDLPSGFVTADRVSENFGTLRYGRLFEGLIYDCRRFLRNDADPATGHRGASFVPPQIEAWLGARTARGDSLHLAHVPSTPILWSAGKGGEWYPDVQDGGGLSLDFDKPYWPRGWQTQHDRLLRAASARRDRIPLFVSGDLHATGAGQILRSGELDLSANPVVSVLSGTPGTAGPGWPSRFRGTRPRPSLTLDAEEWLEPLEENGFTLLDFGAQGVRLSFFRWRPRDGIDAIDHLTPFLVREIPRPSV